MTMTKRTNSYRVRDGVAYIDVSTPKFPRAVCLVDSEDVGHIIDGGGRWLAKQRTPKGAIYAVRQEGFKRDCSQVQMHRVILKLSNPKMHADHKNRNGLDNRKMNLRIASAIQNGANRAINADKKSSRYKGVFRCGNSWRARIHLSGTRINCGSHSTERKAALAYDLKARVLFGQFARTNLNVY